MCFVQLKVVDSIPFQPEWTENLVLVCKPVRGNPPFHLRLNFRVFRWVSGHFGRFTFWGIFYFIFFSLLLTSRISLPTAAASQPSLQRSKLSLSSELTASSLQQGRWFPPHLRPACLQLLPRRPLLATCRIRLRLPLALLSILIQLEV